MTYNPAPFNTLAMRLRRETVMYRKGAEVTEKVVGGIRVTEVFGYPETPSRGELVDVHFVNIGFTEAAADKDGFLTDFRACIGDGEFQSLDAEAWAGGPSYIAIGAWIGTQDLALQLLALGEHYGQWNVITPKVFGVEGAEADALAGGGVVMCSGWKPE